MIDLLVGILLLLISNARSQEETDNILKTVETSNKEDSNDEVLSITQRNEVLGFENQLNKDIKNVERSEFCDKEKEVCSKVVSIPSQSLNNQESASDDSVEPNIDRRKETDPRPDEELRTKPSGDIQNNVYSENENLDLKSKETFNKDEEDTKIGNTQSVTINNEEVLDESSVN
ncbi:uncharacterized protein LOC132713837 [Ruditapes philippinarum]|uniref:uncharacterized protein LOC132713837 n=1 Tax=Ruditapes philippinarum TaxID=129788 RepID=UPI00295B6205|nr:uncharacterized protein LOC132713837 [Ruditapes philippinarum]